MRQLKASTKDKTIWQPEVEKLLALKKQLANAQASAASCGPSDDSVASLEKAIAEQVISFVFKLHSVFPNLTPHSQL